MSNEEVLQRANTSRNLLKVIVNRHIRFVHMGHIVRKSQLQKAISLTGMVEGKRAIGSGRIMRGPGWARPPPKELAAPLKELP